MAKKIGVLGSGVVGKSLAEGFLKHGYDVMLGTRDPDKDEIRKWAEDHRGAKTATFRETAVHGDLIVFAVLAKAVEEVLTLAGPDHLTGKVLIDTNNPLADGAPVEGILPFTTGPNESL